MKRIWISATCILATSTLAHGAAPSSDFSSSPFQVDGSDDQVTTSRLFRDDSPRAAAATCSAQGEQRIALVIVSFPGSTEPLQSPEYYRDLVFSPTSASVDRYFREASYGKTHLSGDVFGPYVLPFHPGCDFDRLASAVFQAMAGRVDLSRYNRVLAIGSGQAGCAGSGISSLGCRTFALPGGAGTFFGSFSWAQSSYSDPAKLMSQRTQVVAHELGHALGFSHARYRTNRLAPSAGGGSTGVVNETVGPLTTTWPGETRLEYGDIYSVMGVGPTVHLSAVHKQRARWLEDYDLRASQPGPYFQKVDRSGDYWIEPMSSADPGIKALSIARGSPGGSRFWVEFRQRTGFDANLLDSPTRYFDGALLHLETPGDQAYTHLLDPRTGDGTTTDSTLPLGSTFVDPYQASFSITSLAVEGGRLKVRVNFDQPVCEDLASIGVIFPHGILMNRVDRLDGVLAIKRNASPSCPPAPVAVTSQLPAGWSAELADAAPVMGPNGSVATRATVISPARAPLRTHSGLFAVGVGEQTARAPTYMTVTPYRLNLAATPGSTTTVRGNVGKGKNAKPVANATVVFTLTLPDGTKRSATAGTNSAGVATATFASASPGAYRLEGHATVRGSGVRTGPVVEFIR